MFQIHQPFPNSQITQFYILGRDQHIFIKQRDLQTASANIQDCRSSGNNIGKSFLRTGNGLIPQKTLFRVTEHIHLHTRILINFSQNDLGIFCLPQSAGSADPIICHLILFHDPPVIIEHLTKLLHHGIAYAPFRISISSQLHAIIHVVKRFQTIFS